MSRAEWTALKFLEHKLISIAEPKVSIPEHFLAVASLLVDNCLVELDGPELPYLGYLEFFETFYRAGLLEQDAPRRAFRLEAPFSFQGTAGQRLVMEPADGLSVDYRVDFSQKCQAIGRQSHSMEVSALSFLRECALARTLYLTSWQIFITGIYRTVNTSRESLKVILAANEEGYLNSGLDGPRYLVSGHSTEVVRHKVGDLLGELALLGKPLLARVRVERGGHSFTIMALKKLSRSGLLREELLE
jgi:UDP-3-O-[3-hydroxymyristoyl] N-acetylglucosamine deacetylase